MKKGLLLWNQYKGRILTFICSCLGLYGICYLLELSGSVHFAYNSLSLFLLPVIYGLLQAGCKDLLAITDRSRRRRRILYSFGLSFCFALSMILGYQLRIRGMTESGFVAKGMILLRSALLAIPVFPFANAFFGWLDRMTQGTSPVRERRIWKTKYLFFISFAIIFLCWIPVWMAYYPIIMSYDFHRQINEAVRGFAFFNSYQPLIHTLLLWCGLQLGTLLHSTEAGMGIVTLFQMLVTALSMAYACTAVYRMLHRKWCVILLLLFYGIFPFTSVSVMVGSKDAIFGALFLTFTILTMELLFFRSGKQVWLTLLFMVITAIPMMLFRNNAIYAMAVTGILLVLLVPLRDKWKVLLFCSLLVILGKAGQEGLQQGLGTTLRGSDAEKYSVLIQQFARVGYYHGEELDEETYALLSKYVSPEGWEKYLPGLTDSARSGVSFYDTWAPDMKQVFKDWFQIGLQYPNEYIDAFLYVTSGYWFPDDISFAETQGYGPEERKGAIYTNNSSSMDEYGEIAHISKFPWLEEKLEEIVSNNAFYNWPVLSFFFKSSTYCWLLFITIIGLLYCRKKRQLIVCLFPLIYFGTMLLGPCVQFRYVFPIMITVPVLAALLLLPQKADRPQEQQTS